jgi:hypothetical protein
MPARLAETLGTFCLALGNSYTRMAAASLAHGASLLSVAVKRWQRVCGGGDGGGLCGARDDAGEMQVSGKRLDT